MTAAPVTNKDDEIESKFEASSQFDLDLIENLFLKMSDEKRRERRYETIIRYMDTPDRALHRADVVLRTMDACAGFFKPELAIKTKGTLTAAGVLSRKEFSFDMPTNTLDLSVIDKPEAEALIAPAKGKPLSEIFNTVTRRHDICLMFNLNGKKAAIDLALDDVSYNETETGDCLRRAFEMEVEFKQSYSDPAITRAEAEELVGTLTALFKQQANLTPVYKSRAEIGYDLVETAFLNRQVDKMFKDAGLPGIDRKPPANGNAPKTP